MPSRASRPKGSAARRGPGRRDRRSMLARLRWPITGVRWPGTGLLGHVRNWLRRHLQTLLGSLGRLSEQPVATGMTLAVIGIALALPASLHLLVANLQVLSGHWDDGIELSLYLEHGQPTESATALAEEIGAWPEVEAVELVTADEALARFRAGSGLGATVDALDTNPLPHLVIVRPAGGGEALAMEALAERLRALPGADVVQADADGVRRLSAMLEI